MMLRPSNTALASDLGGLVAKNYRSDALRWVEIAEEMGDTMIPPVYMILHEDLLAKVGWTRLVPSEAGFVTWTDFKKYLGDYFNKNAGSTLCEYQLDPARPAVAKNDALRAAASLCLEKEGMLFMDYLGDLATDDVKLIIQIRDFAKEIIQSEGDGSVVATAGFVCIAREAELMFNLLGLKNTTKMVALSNKIRRSAFNLMLYKGSESFAAAGAMVGISQEAALVLDLLSRTERDLFLQYNICDAIRNYTVPVLTMLEEEFACETDAANDTSEEPMGVSNVNLKIEESDCRSNLEDSSLIGED